MIITGVDLSKIFGVQTKILGRGQKVVKSDKYMGVSQLLEGHVPGLPPTKVNAYGDNFVSTGNNCLDFRTFLAMHIIIGMVNSKAKSCELVHLHSLNQNKILR